MYEGNWKINNKIRIKSWSVYSFPINPFQFVLNASTNFSLYDLSKITLVQNTQLHPAKFGPRVHLFIPEIIGAFQRQ